MRKVENTSFQTETDLKFICGEINHVRRRLNQISEKGCYIEIEQCVTCRIYKTKQIVGMPKACDMK
jgi:hypothetical protein